MQQAEFHRQRAPANARVDPRGVGFRFGPRVRRKQRDLGFGYAAHAEDAHPAVDREHFRPERLGQSPLDKPALELHLPQPVVRMDKPLRKHQIERTVRVDVRHAPTVKNDLHRRFQAGNNHPTLGAPLPRPTQRS